MRNTISRRRFVALASSALVLPRQLFATDKPPKVPPMLDHILLGCSDLDKGMAFVEQHTGVRPAVGGVHPGRGTRNALLSLGEMHYLEVIAPDPAQASLTAKPPSMLYTLRHLDAPRIVTWAAHTNDMNAVAERLRKASIGFEGPTPGSRKRPDGRVLELANPQPEQRPQRPTALLYSMGSRFSSPFSRCPGWLQAGKVRGWQYE